MPRETDLLALLESEDELDDEIEDEDELEDEEDDENEEDDEDDDEDESEDGSEDESEEEEDEDDEDDKKSKDGKVLQLTQKELDAKIKKRLERAQRQHEKELKALKESGTTKKSEADELIERLAKEGNMSVEEFIRTAKRKNLELKLADKAKAEGVSASYLAELELLRLENEELKKTKAGGSEESEAQKTKDLAEIKKLKEKYPKLDTAALLKDKLFAKMLKVADKDMPLSKIYEEYAEISGGIKKKVKDNVDSKQKRSLGSGRGSASGDGTYGLNKDQLKLAKENGISPKDFAKALKNRK